MGSEVIWIIVINLALYLKTLRHKFVSDDFSVFHNPPKFKNRWHKRWLQFTGQCKLKSKTFWILRHEGKWFLEIKETEEQEHLLALLIHILICIAIYYAFGVNQVSFIAAMLYAVNPINNQATIWPGGRGYALPILSLAFSMAVPLLAPALLYFCSWYTIGFLAPLTLIGSEKWYLLGLMPFIWALHARKWTTAITKKASFESFTHDKKYDWNKVVVAVKTYGFYFILCIFPFRITFYHNFLQSLAGNDIMRKRAQSMDRYFWSGLFILIFGAIYSYLHWNPLSWAWLAFTIGIIPYCNIYRANQEIAERFCALPNMFLMYLLAQLIAPYPIAFAAFLVFYATRTYYTVDLYSNEYCITEMAVIEDPHAWWAWHCRAMKRWETQSYREALILWTMARLISPKEFKVLMNIATCLRLLKNNKEADVFLKLAEESIIAGQEAEAAKYIDNHREGKLPILL